VNRRSFLLLTLAALCAAAQPVNFSTLDGKVLLGYQGWFNCPGDGDERYTWRSWARGVPEPATLTVDMYPDLSEFPRADLCPVPGMTIGGGTAYLYSAWNPAVVDRHFLWMKQYGLDGVLLQRFVTSMAAKRNGGDIVLRNVMAAAAKHGRAFAIEYDVTGSDPAKFFALLQEDWKYLVEEVGVTRAPGYLRHEGKPLLSVWGMGLEDPRHPPRDAAPALRVVEWFKTGAPPALRVTYMGGTPARWRTRTADAQRDAAWDAVYARMDVIQPWTVGRYRDLPGVDRWREEMLAPDAKLLAGRHQDYMPVVFPGFSWQNLKRDTQPNQIPRLGGRFLWQQAANARAAGARMLKIAMFDEVNEGTAVFKTAARRADAPAEGFWLTLDADGETLPRDWYLRVSGAITRLFRGDPKAAFPTRN
jgi:hypothetical protein